MIRNFVGGFIMDDSCAIAKSLLGCEASRSMRTMHFFMKR